MINTIPGGFFEHAEDQRLHANPGFFSNSFMAPSPTGGGGGVSPKAPGMEVIYIQVNMTNM